MNHISKSNIKKPAELSFLSHSSFSSPQKEGAAGGVFLDYPLYSIVTLGCKVNGYESDKIRQELASYGIREACEGETAHICIVNTCAVTGEAARKSRQAARKLKRLSPDAVIYVAGCAAQSSSKDLEGLPSDMIIVNNDEKEFLSHHIAADFKLSRITLDKSLILNTHQKRTRAYLKVQDGCNAFCSYCIIPYLRGRSRSRPPEEILAELHALEKGGHQEAVITGIHLGDYGRGLSEKTSLPKLLDFLAVNSSIPRIRLSSIEPMNFSFELLEVFHRHERICRHLHLPLQHAGDKILKLMNRNYTLSQYNKIAATAAENFPSMNITTDVIAGFPGETEEDFDILMNYLQEAPFFRIHAFPYSPRQGTKAYDMPDRINKDIKKQRLGRIISLGRKKMHSIMDKYLGKQVEVLPETIIPKEDIEKVSAAAESLYYFSGHTDNYMEAVFSSQDFCLNKIVKVQVEERIGEKLYGKRVISLCN